MKTIKKILPILATAGVATIPLATTSCSNVWIDLLAKPYQPSFEVYTALDGTGEVTSKEAMEAYREHFLKSKGDLIPDFYWGSSHYARKGLPSETRKVLTFLSHIENMNITPASATATMSAPVLSYHAKTQMEVKDFGVSKSYAINTYDLDWEFNNLQVWPVYYRTIDDVHCWSISPIKFDTIHSVWWQELKGNERIKFDFKAVFKGYSDRGAQNYVRETNEAAVIDEAHKYAPELNEVYTNVMLFDSYYLSASMPKIVCQNSDVKATYDSGTETYTTNDLSFDLGSNTHTKYNDYKLKFSVYKDLAYVYSQSGSGAKVDGSKIYCGADKEISKIAETEGKYKVTLNPTFKVEEAEPKSGDYLYYIIQIDCVKDGETDPAWTEYLFTSTLIKQ